MVLPFKNDIDECIKALEKGGLILYPTDTIWGIGCDATNAQAIEKIFRLKKRSDNKSMIVLLADEQDILQYVTQLNPRVSDYIKGIGKPTTVIYEGAVGFPENLIPPDRTVAIRVVNDRFCKELIKRFGKPIVSSSANISGYPPPSVFADIDIAIKNGVDHVVEYRQDDLTPAHPSSLIKWNADGSVNIIRP